MTEDLTTGDEHALEASGREPRFKGTRAEHKDFAKRLGRIIHGRGIRQAELARKSDLSPHAISSYMLGKAIPTPVNLTKMARALDMEPSELLPNPSDDNEIVYDAPISLVVDYENPMRATLRVNMQVPTSLGGEIVKLLVGGGKGR